MIQDEVVERERPTIKEIHINQVQEVHEWCHYNICPQREKVKDIYFFDNGDKETTDYTY